MGSGWRPGCSTACPGCWATRTTRPVSSRATSRCAQALRRHPGWRVPRSGLVLESLAPAAVEQLVTGQEAFRSWRLLLLRHGELGPGPGAELRAAGAAERRPVEGAAVVGLAAGRRGPQAVQGRRARGRDRRRPARGDRRAARCRGRAPVCAPSRASGSGPRPRCASGPTATPTRSASATTTWPRTSAGRCSASSSTTTRSPSCWSPTGRIATGCSGCSSWPAPNARAAGPRMAPRTHLPSR